MQFYKIVGGWITSVGEDEIHKMRRNISRKVLTKTAEFNGAGRTQFCFLADVEDDIATFGIIVERDIDPFELADSFLQKHWSGSGFGNARRNYVLLYAKSFERRKPYVLYQR